MSKYGTSERITGKLTSPEPINPSLRIKIEMWKYLG